MPGGIHFLFGLILLYILQWLVHFLNWRSHKEHHSPKGVDSNTSVTTSDDSTTSPDYSPLSTKHVDENTTFSSLEDVNGELKNILHRIYKRKQDRGWFQFGIIVGSILPDVDLCVAIVTIVLCFLFLGYGADQNRVIAEYVHRGATHSIILCIPALLYCIYLYNKKDRTLLERRKRLLISQMRILTEKQHTAIGEHYVSSELIQEGSEPPREHSPTTDDEDTSCILRAAAPTQQVTSEVYRHHKSTPYDKLSFWGKLRHDFKWINLPFAMGVLVGAIFHILLDLIYMKGVKLWWPIYQEEIFYEIPSLYLYDNFKYPPMVQKILMSIDHVSEVLFYVAVIIYRNIAGMNQPNSELVQEAKPIPQDSSHHKHSIVQSHHTFTNLLKHLKNLPYSYKHLIEELWNASEQDWHLFFKYCCFIQLFVISLTFSLMYFFFPDMGLVQYVIYIYFPGTVFVIISLLSPFCFRNTLMEWDWSHIIPYTPKHVSPRPHTKRVK